MTSHPLWDGEDPDKQVELYLEFLQECLQTPRPPKQQQGMTVLHYATGDLRLVINELDVTTLTSVDGGERVYKHMQSRTRSTSRKIASIVGASVAPAERQAPKERALDDICGAQNHAHERNNSCTM